jgi:thymidylate synthase (FAD)
MEVVQSSEPRVLSKAKIICHYGLEHSRQTLEKIEHCGRVSSLSWHKETEDSAQGFVRSMLRQGHETVVEHHSVTFVVLCDRVIAQQLTRHRLASFTMESQRYCDYSKCSMGYGVDFIDPEAQFDEPSKMAEYRALLVGCVQMAEKTYLDMLAMGARPEDARAVLPNCTAVTVTITANLREWRHILKTRTSDSAQHNIRKLMEEILDIFKANLPCIFEDM